VQKLVSKLRDTIRRIVETDSRPTLVDELRERVRMSNDQSLSKVLNNIADAIDSDYNKHHNRPSKGD